MQVGGGGNVDEIEAALPVEHRLKVAVDAAGIDAEALGQRLRLVDRAVVDGDDLDAFGARPGGQVIWRDAAGADHRAAKCPLSHRRLLLVPVRTRNRAGP